MKTLFVACLTVLSVFTFRAEAHMPAQAFFYVSPELQSLTSIIYYCPESRALLSKVQKQGNISVNYLDLGKSGTALWDGDKRAIVLNSSANSSKGERLRCILFEMHNALNDKQFLYYDALAEQGKINKREYVEAIEWIEYQNALSTYNLIEKGIQEGYFPSDTHWSVPQHFNEHFRMQQEMGHTKHIAYCFDLLTHSY